MPPQHTFIPAHSGISYIRVKGFIFQHAGNPYPFPQYGMVSLAGGDHWILEDNTIEWANGGGLDIGSDGNSTNGAQLVVVQDTELPLITAPPAVTVTADPGTNYATGVSLGTPVTSDNCGVAAVTNDAPSAFPIGTNTVTWTVTDVHGNVADAWQSVVVNPAPRLPHQITSLVISADGTVTLEFAGTANVQYFVQVSSNLVDWTTVHTNIAASDGTWTYVDSTAPGSSTRFYRSVQP